MNRLLQAVKVCALLDLSLLVAWLITLAINPTLAAHIAFVVIAGAAAILAGALLSAPFWLPLGVLIMALATGNTLVGFLSAHVPNFKQKLFGGVTP